MNRIAGQTNNIDSENVCRKLNLSGFVFVCDILLTLRNNAPRENIWSKSGEDRTTARILYKALK